jgi:hypothetical protein
MYAVQFMSTYYEIHLKYCQDTDAKIAGKRSMECKQNS